MNKSPDLDSEMAVIQKMYLKSAIAIFSLLISGPCLAEYVGGTPISNPEKNAAIDLNSGTDLPLDPPSLSERSSSKGQADEAAEAGTKAAAGQGRETTEHNKVVKKLDENRQQTQAGLGRAQSKLKENIITAPANDPARRVEVENDTQVVKATKKLVQQEKVVPKMLAEQAKDPEIKKNLLLVSEQTQERENLKKEEVRLTANIAELGKLAAAAATVAANMGETKAPQGMASSSLGTQASRKNAGASTTPESKATANNGEESEVKLEGLSDKEKIALLKDLEPSKYKTGSKAKDLSLKNKLITQLKAVEASENKGAGDVASGVDKNGKTNNAAAKVISDVLTPPANADGDYNTAGGGKRSGGFSLSTSETNAEVKRLTEEANRQLTAADDTKAGILEIESPSLFERVKTRITGCLRQRCVNSKSLAKN